MKNPSTILSGDNRKLLKSLPARHFHCAVTSPPYYKLRSYLPDDSKLKRFEIGQEKTPSLYVAALIETFTELWRVMRDDGTLWLNIGDCYFGDSPCRKKSGDSFSGAWNPSDSAGNGGSRRSAKRVEGFKPKDLIGVPWRVAFALQAAGWYLRSGIPWIKRNCMPESCEDRPSSALEYVFLLTKSPDYFYDLDAVRVNSVCDRMRGPSLHRSGDTNGNAGLSRRPTEPTRNRRNSDWFMESWQGLWHEDGIPVAFIVNPMGFKDAHFATFPTKLVDPMILAGTSEHGCCESCGAPYTRIVEKGEPDREHQKACGGDTDGLYSGQATKNYEAAGVQNASDLKRRVLAGMTKKKTVGWKPGCECVAGVVPCRVIDPFCGTATVGEVCLNHRREFTGIDLNPEYQEMQKRRTSQSSLI